MDLRVLNQICFTICVICIVLGTTLGLIMIWGDIEKVEVAWKSMLTIVIVFAAAAMTLSVSRTYEGWRGKD